jgi:hypothetical protein
MLAGDPTSQNRTDSFNIFIDSDKNPMTGYRVNGLGADNMVEVYGRKGTYRGSSVMSYDRARDPKGLDWNAWKQLGAPRVGIRASEMEVQMQAFDLVDSKGGSMNAYLVSKGYDGSMDQGNYVQSEKVGQLQVIQQSTGVKVLESSGSATLLKLEFKVVGKDAMVSGIMFTAKGDFDLKGISIEGATVNFKDGKATAVFEPPISAKMGQTKTLQIKGRQFGLDRDPGQRTYR